MLGCLGTRQLKNKALGVIVKGAVLIVVYGFSALFRPLIPVRNICLT
jgi:hypothetical protein